MSTGQTPPGVPVGDGDATMPRANPDRPPSTLFDERYRIERIIGQGAFGRVFLAFDTRLRRNIAVKELLAARNKTNATTYEQYLERFQREARAAGVVQHPNIVAVHELAIDPDDNHYLMMEYVDGTNLRDLLAQVGTLPVERAVTIALEVARALEAVHEQEIVHRDLKPANIMLTRRGVAKVTDFGVAQVGTESMRTHVVSGHPGTPIYMSPEQRSGSGYLDGRSDLYSLGLILYEMLAGGTYARKRQPLNIVRPDLAPQLIAIVNKLMAGDANDRYQYAGEVVEALGTLGGTYPTFPTAEVSPSPIGDPPRLGGPGSQVPPTFPPLGVPSVYGGAASDPPPGAPASTVLTPSPATGGGMPRYTAATTANRAGSKRVLWLGVAGGAALIAVIGLVAFMLAGKSTPTTATASPRGGTTVVSPVAGTTATGTAGTAVVGSPVPDTAYVVADAKNLVTYAYPKEWKTGGVTGGDVDVVAGYTLFNPDGLIVVAKEDVTASTTLDGYVDDSIARTLRKDPNWKPGPINRQNAMIAGQDARVIDLLQPSTSDGGLVPKGGTIYQYFIITLHDNRAWIIGYATNMDQKDVLKKQYDVVANTFAFCPTSGCARQQTVPTVAPGQTTKWADPAKLLTAEYPVDWFATPDDKLQESQTLALISPDGISFSIYAQDQPMTLDQEAQIFQDNRAKDANYKYTTAPAADTTVGGEPGKVLSYTYVPTRDPSAKARNGLIWIVNRGGKTFFFEGFNIQARRADIEKIVGSVAFTGPAGTPVSQATAAPTPRPTTQAAAPTIRATPVGGYGADFSKWPTTEVAGKYRKSFDPATGELHIALFSDSNHWLFFAPETLNVADFVLDVDARLTTGPDAGRYGVVFRVQPQGANDKARADYEFLIDGQGHYMLIRGETDNSDTSIQELIAAPPGVIKGGINAVNHLTVTCKGNKITLAVNGTTLNTYTATVVQPGTIGVSLSAPSSIYGVEVSYTNLRLSPP